MDHNLLITEMDANMSITNREPDLPITNNPFLPFFPQADRQIVHSSPVSSNNNDNIQPQVVAAETPLRMIQSSLQHDQDQEIPLNNLEKW